MTRDTTEHPFDCRECGIEFEPGVEIGCPEPHCPYGDPETREEAWMRLFHGGVPGLRAGDLIEPGHGRKVHEGCEWCAARAELPPERDGLPGLPDRVYLTPVRLYARYYASLYGRGDLYQVEPLGALEPSTEDNVESWTAPTARVLAAVDRAVLLTPAERRRLALLWGRADIAAQQARKVNA